MSRARSTPKPKRTYQQAARADATAATADAIVEAALALLYERWIDELTLADIAERAGVNVRTVIRRFGTRDGVVEAAVDRFRAALEAQPARPLPAPGDVGATVRLLMDYYEGASDFLQRGLSQETRFPFLKTNFDASRARHRAWIGEALRPQLDAVSKRHRALRHSQLAAVTWITSWRYLRVDSGHSRDETETALREMVLALAFRPVGPRCQIPLRVGRRRHPPLGEAP